VTHTRELPGPGRGRRALADFL